MHHLTRVLAVHLMDRYITVNAIAPGLFPSQMTRFVFSSDEGQQRIEENYPLGRAGAPEDMAALAIYLASPGAAYLNGAVIPLDGGISLANRQ